MFEREQGGVRVTAFGCLTWCIADCEMAEMLLNRFTISMDFQALRDSKKGVIWKHEKQKSPVEIRHEPLKIFYTRLRLVKVLLLRTLIMPVKGGCVATAIGRSSKGGKRKLKVCDLTTDTRL